MIIKSNKIILSEEEEQWLIAHYPYTKNKEVAEKLGISYRSVVRFASRLGLKKTKQFLGECQNEAWQAACRSYDINGHPLKGGTIPNSERIRFKKGVSSVERLGEEKERQRLEKSRVSRMKTLKREKARVIFGLPQRTKLKVVSQPREKITLRYYLKKQGYILDEQKRIAYYDENTKRGKRIESKPQMWYKFQPLN